MSKHVIYPLVVDEVDEIDEDMQLALVWCYTHKTWEEHNVPVEDLHDDIIQSAEVERYG